MNTTIKKSLLLIFNFLLLIFLILYDPRSVIIAEPVPDIYHAISIGVSRLVYDIEGFLGLNEVFERLKQIPSASNYYSKYFNHLGGFILDFENINQIKEYNKIIEEKIFESQNLSILKKDSFHLYGTDIGYIFYVLCSFLLFGVKLNSISILFIFILIISSIIFMINFYKNNIYFFLLQTILFSFIIAIISNYGGDAQITSLTNYRFLSILSLIPLLHLSLIFLNKDNLNITSFFFAIFQFFLLIFLCLVRGTTLWIFLFLIIFYSIWILQIGIKDFNKYKINIFLMSITIFLFLSIFNFSKHIIEKNLADDYNVNNNEHGLVEPKHAFWHNIFIGMAMNSKIYESYVCSDVKLDYFSKKEKNYPCDIYASRFPGKYELFKYIVYYRPHDGFSYHAAVNYLYKNKLNEKLTIVPSAVGGTYVVVSKNEEGNESKETYEGILKKLYFDIILNHPLEYFYTQLILKPLKLIFQLFKFIFYFFNGFGINFLFTISIFIFSLLIQIFTIFNIRIEEELAKDKAINYNYLIKSILVYMFLSIGTLSIVFYASSQSATYDAAVVLIVLLIFSFRGGLRK